MESMLPVPSAVAGTPDAPTNALGLGTPPTPGVAGAVGDPGGAAGSMRGDIATPPGIPIAMPGLGPRVLAIVVGPLIAAAISGPPGSTAAADSAPLRIGFAFASTVPNVGP